MQFGTGDYFQLTASSNKNTKIFDEIPTINSSVVNSEMNIRKSSDVSKEKLIPLNEDTLFEFNCEIEDDNLIITLYEVDALAPFVYTESLTLDDMFKAHRMFESCKNLDEVKEHIDNLFKKKMVKLTPNKENEITFEFKAWYISYMDEFKIITKRKMTEHKDEMLMNLYNIQKEKLKLLNDIEAYLKKNKNIEIDKIIKEIKEEKK